MTTLSGDAKEVIYRNQLVSIALKQGYNAYLPVYDSGVDLILHREEDRDTKLVQQKARWTIDKKYIGRDIWIAFPDGEQWYLVPHDELLILGKRHTKTQSWDKGLYSKSPLSKQDKEQLAQYLFG
ncbi:MAG: hypothetical protein QNI87_03875 [Erythrobacter sp.]|uniref:hypothetical protein n=1 Tax=Erythrobacter sp. TaxID=1042 RepID=UPI0026247082|nr:hypothetical protein [Erythrobacter sp.]MDJ0977652.1 hypothetical protein [Erythrobacter sp.]